MLYRLFCFVLCYVVPFGIVWFCTLVWCGVVMYCVEFCRVCAMPCYVMCSSFVLCVDCYRLRCAVLVLCGVGSSVLCCWLHCVGWYIIWCGSIGCAVAMLAWGVLKVALCGVVW